MEPSQGGQPQRHGSEERQRIEDAVRRWWRGGGTTRRLVNLLEDEHATEEEARYVAQRLAAAADRLHFLSDSVMLEELEKARAVGAARALPIERTWDGRRCVYEDGVVCPECAQYGDPEDPNPIVHGHLLAPEDLASRLAELRELLSIPHELR